MKSKYLALGLSAVMVLSLASCGGQQAQEPQEPKQEIQQAEPISTEPTAISEEVKQEIVSTVLEEGQSVQDGDVSGEVDEAGEIEPVVELFTDVEETVYAVGSVNLRSGPGTENEKVGSLNKGDSVVRTGVGINDAEGWSRVQLADGSTVYVSSKFISVTKPTTQTAKPSTSTQTTKPSGTQTTTPSGGGSQQTSNPSDSMPGLGGDVDLSQYVGQRTGGTRKQHQWADDGDDWGKLTAEQRQEAYDKMAEEIAREQGN